ncbi:thiosulfate sulfurtransferase PspE precursor [Anaerotignum neopropionicum]|uniref:Thiosulfate sulfurtransferase PspE n=1 Tax=Anaerotignum neopropionicum TaxID=36847 RepID=A0A136WCC2_9FIRM|nr:rhodanese-like domain-containing protein [Anaerotignum neopropionicum]KXL52161.1 thiosulfate sulfurtransferase PspE precursor [Anaerotignum neopropionicum]
MIRYLVCALIGGIIGYFVFYKLIGCSNGSCPITANPYISTAYGMVLGVLLAVVIAPLAGTVNLGDSTQPPAVEYKKITSEEAKARIDSGDEVIILDVRTKDEFNSSHIPNAILLPNETISDKMLDLLPDLDAEILIYCRSGNRSAQAAKKLIAIGYTNVYDFAGIIDWPYDTVTES